MKPIYIYPGSFNPPTYGHVEIAKRITNLVGEVTVICSSNPDKEDSWFTPEECKEMWQSYSLCPNIKVKTFEESISEDNDLKNFVMVRGIRDVKDLDYEKEVVLFNYKNFGIVNYFYMISDGNYKHISSTSARKLAENLGMNGLKTQVSDFVADKMLMKFLNKD